MDEGENDRLVERLIEALGAQLEAAGPVPLVVEALTGLSRDQALWIFGHAGLMVHYGTDGDGLNSLIDLLTGIVRAETPEDAVFRPGDAVRLVGALPPGLAAYDERLLREMRFTVRWFTGPGAVDIQPDLWDDFVIETVPAASLERVPQV